ncbi:hypothetical protein BA723_09420 [Helicobacter sp. CLO-3]|nr:hypothetical protein BA723_09420 [Helicobacter sp. CLO-3]
MLAALDFVVIARSKATKQSTRQNRARHRLLKKLALCFAGKPARKTNEVSFFSKTNEVSFFSNDDDKT